LTPRRSITLAAFALALAAFALAALAIATLSLNGCNESSDSSSSSQPAVEPASPPELPAFDVAEQVVELSCGQCQFGLPGASCDLAVRIDGTAYFVDSDASSSSGGGGAWNIDSFGDAHAKDGLCNCIKHARISGRVEKGRFAAATIEVVQETADGG